MLRLVFFNFLLQRIDSARVSTASLIDFFAYPSHVQQYCHPNVSNNNINGYHGRENFTTHFVHSSYTSFIAAWFAPPPIQLPATVVMPRQTASGPAPSNTSGNSRLTISNAIGPPMTTPRVPVRNKISSLGPSRRIDFKSKLKVNNTKHAGSK